ncbi:MAG TPA: 2-hydroxyacid dehydrogenase, partial [Candidatus Eremiobacteraceae bacterium]|nr:2-hydroxyacid dehydrogenase [Candidatus Eremiobacteraceae bacterium]
MKIAIVGVPGWSERLRAKLGDGADIVEVDPSERAQLARVLADADIVISGRFNARTAALCHSLKLLICPWAGTENMDRSALPPGVKFTNAGGTEEPIAEHVIGVLVALRRRLLDADRKLRDGIWASGFWGGALVEEVLGSTLGLLGYGRIGREVVKRAAAFGVRCRALTLHPERVATSDAACEVGALADPASVDSLVAWSDALVICCELSDLTRGMLDGRRLGLMKPNAVLINVARAPIVVERELYETLRDKRIAGAALDVWYQYPKAAGERAVPSAFPFGKLENVIMTPHYSGWTAAA